MKTWTIALFALACGFSTGAAAQAWTVYTPAERDFQAVFPQPPSRADDGAAVAFRSTVANIDYVVFRRDPRREPVGDAVRVMQRHLRAAADDERQAQRVGDEEADPRTTEVVFRTGNRMSVHRLFVAADRYYELMVRSTRQDFDEARGNARDFFGSFRASGIAFTPGAGAPGLSPDQLCKDRSNAISRTFCEYRTCFQAGYEKHPYCMTLLRR
jgi:hypothetical protein